MKNKFILSLLIATTLSAQAAPVEMQTVREVAIKFVNANAKMPLRGAEDLQLVTTYRTESNNDAFHIFNTPNGFVIVSADDCATPILGYSDEGSFEIEDIPIQLQEYLQGFVEQIQYGIENHVQDETTTQQWERVQAAGRLTERSATTEVTPLMTDIWNQNCYYNELCPLNSNGPCGHTLTGCAATSFAQILHYWGYPETGTGSHTYTPKGYPQQTANFGATTYDWANMPNNLSSSSTSIEINAVATLMWHCGVAVDMRYGPTFSGADPTDIATALVDYFNYSDELSIVFRDDYSDAEWLTLMKNCLDLGRPIHYSGFNMEGGGGHGFVCDGYNTSDQLHFNWGWGGTCNGYYSISAMNPGPYMLSYYNLAIIDIHPSINTFHFTTAGNWSEPSNWQGRTLPGANDVVIIDAPCQLDQNTTVAALTISDGQSITLQSGKTLTVTDTLTNTATTGLVIEDGAQLIHDSENVSATVKKNIVGYGSGAGDYYLISNPLTLNVNPETENINLTSGNYDLYYWLANASDSLEWKNYKKSNFTLSSGGCGYLYANQNDVELTLSGTLRPSNVNFSKSVGFVSGDGYHFVGWNLIGNPFVCDAYLVNADNQSLPYYRMNADRNDMEAVAAGAIAPMESIFYEASENETIYFTKNAPEMSGGRINLSVYQNGNSIDNAIIHIGEGHSLEKLRFGENNGQLSFNIEGKDYAVVSSDDVSEMFVNFKAGKNGAYTFCINTEKLNVRYLYLFDNLTGDMVDLQETPSYTFESKMSDRESRFKLVFNTNRP